MFRQSALNLRRAIDMTRTMISCRAGASLDPKEVRNSMDNLSEGGTVHPFPQSVCVKQQM